MVQSGESEKGHLICAIVTPNYLNQFLILGESIARAMPAADLRVLILQDCSGTGPFQERIDHYLAAAGSSANHQAITIDQCDWEDFDIESASLFYNILEFATSVKPALLRFFLRQDWQRVTYLDPDIQIFNDFLPVLDNDMDVSLTPHLFTDIPRDDFKPSTNDILSAGFFNLGFCSVRPTALPFLDWWCERLQFDCLIDHSAGYFTDQKILDLAPLKTNVQVVMEPGCNVAYWNLHERRIVKDQGEWKVVFDGSIQQLYFFHFSGFILNRSPSLSKHASRRVLGDAVPRSFASQYEKLLRDGSRQDEDVEFTIGGASLKKSIPVQWRRCLREDAEVHVRAGLTLRQVREEIYFPRYQNKWSKCLTCGIEHGNFGTRVQTFLAGWACHPSLQGVPNAISAFFRTSNHQFRASAMEQLIWASDNFQEDVRGNDELVAEVLGTAAQSIEDSVDLKLVGYFSYPAGVGQVARWALRTLEEANIHPAIDRVFVNSDSYEYLSDLLKRKNPLGASNAGVLCFVNADQWEVHVTSPQRVNPKIQHVEAVWAWELEHIPSRMYTVASSGEIERVHALSNWSAHAMSKVLPVPVDRFAPFDLNLLETLLKPQAATTSKPPPLYILTSFDAKSYLSRKNPEAVLNLWQRVQADYPDHSLIIKSTNLRDFAPSELLELIDASARTVLIDEHYTDSEYFNLLGKCDAFVSLHRSEGMGLTPIEAGLCGLPVLYTNYGGISEFMEEGFFPVSYNLIQVGENQHETGPYDKLAWWAEPDLDDAERQLRRALGISTNGDSINSITVDRKKLQENLVAAQNEVVSAALRLMKLEPKNEGPDDGQLIGRLEAHPKVIDGQFQKTNLNPILFAMVAVIYSGYKLLPARVRFQCSSALNKLRG
jgi:glycosyltransferase involved in cell wall biosynthesis